jgi:hypothetical protein
MHESCAFHIVANNTHVSDIVNDEIMNTFMLNDMSNPYATPFDLWYTTAVLIFSSI